MTQTTAAEVAAVHAANYRPGKYLSVIPRTSKGAGVVESITYDPQTGSIYELVLVGTPLSPDLRMEGMTLDIGTTAGGFDIGRTRVRNVPSSSVIPIALSAPSALAVAPGHYVTIRDEYRIWQVDYKIEDIVDGDGDITGVNEWLDFNLTFGSPHFGGSPKANITAGTITRNGIPRPILVPPAAWEDTPGSGVRTQHFSMAWARAMTFGKTIAGGIWIFGDGTILGSGLDTDAEVDVEFPIGFRHIFLIVTDEDAYTHLMVYPIWAHDASYMPLTNFEIPSDVTDGDSGRELTLEFEGNPGDAPAALLAAGATCSYWEVPDFGGAPKPAAYCDSTLLWITKDTPLLRVVDARYTVQAAGAAWWLDHLDGSTQALRDISPATPESWWELPHIDVRRAVFFPLWAYSTAHTVVNFFFTEAVPQTERAVNIDAGTIWEQGKDSSSQFGMCTIACDSFGHVWLEKIYSMRTPGERIGIEPLLSLFGQHFTDDGLALATRQAPNYAKITGAGDFAQADGKLVLYASAAPGKTRSAGTNTGKLPGQRLPEDRPQTALNELTGLYYGWKNNDQPSVDAPLMANLDVVEPAWQRPIRITWTENTLHGVTLNQALYMVNRVTRTHNNGTPEDVDNPPPAKMITWELEKVTYALPGQTIPVPIQDEGVTLPEELVCDEIDCAWDSLATACSVAFTDDSTPHVVSYWVFGDDESSPEENPTHIYAAPGVYVVQHYVVDECGRFAGFTDTITVEAEEATAEFSVETLGADATLTDESTVETEVVGIIVDWGDGSDPTTDLEHTYAIPGTYTVTESIITACGTAASVSHDIEITFETDFCHVDDFRTTDGLFVVDAGSWVSGRGFTLDGLGGFVDGLFRINFSPPVLLHELTIEYTIAQVTIGASVEGSIHLYLGGVLIAGLPGAFQFAGSQNTGHYTVASGDKNVTIDEMIIGAHFNGSPGGRTMTVNSLQVTGHGQPYDTINC